MKYGKYIFSNYKEFQNIQNLAIREGFEIVEQFGLFLEQNYSQKKRITQR